VLVQADDGSVEDDQQLDALAGECLLDDLVASPEVVVAHDGNFSGGRYGPNERRQSAGAFSTTIASLMRRQLFRGLFWSAPLLMTGVRGFLFRRVLFYGNHARVDRLGFRHGSALRRVVPLRETWTLLLPGSENGTLVAFGAMGGEPMVIDVGEIIFKQKKVEGFWLSKMNADIGAMVAKVASGTLKLPVSAIYPLDQAGEAAAASVRALRRGKVLLRARLSRCGRPPRWRESSLGMPPCASRGNGNHCAPCATS
jgi:hypothetical protein